jgi:hypothetical protein
MTFADVLLWAVLSLVLPLALSWKVVDPLISTYCKAFAKRHNAKFNGFNRIAFVGAVILFQTLCQVGFFVQVSRFGYDIARMIGRW